jgi:hypothetical protein
MKENGGPAFPFMPQCAPGEWALGQSGMTMRQFYKGMALIGVRTEDLKWLANYVGEIADVMLAEDKEASRG